MPAYQKPPLGIMESIHAAIPGPIRALTDFFIGGPDDVPMPVGMAKVPKPDKAFGAIGPAMDGLRRLYHQTDTAKHGLTDFAREAFNDPGTAGLIKDMEPGPGKFIKDLRGALHRANDPNSPVRKMAQMMDEDVDNAGTETAYNLIETLVGPWLRSMK